MKNPFEIEKSLITTEEVEGEISKLDKKEKKLFDSLVRLGDSKSLAVATVICERDRIIDHEFYRFAYEQ